jgi:di/tricarboxylate transporter
MIEYLAQHLWQMWAIVAVVCLILELMAGDFFIICFSIGAVFAAITAAVGCGIYWQLLSYCCACGGCLLFVGSLTGQAVLEVERIRFKWYIRHYLWRALVAWAVGLGVFWLTH